MNSKLIGSLFIIVTLVVGVVAFAPSAFAQSTASVTVKQGASSQGCEADKSCFQPDDVNVDVGGTVTWTNTDSNTHTVSSGKPSDDVAGTIFDTGISAFKAGKTFSHTFTEAGTFDYFCQLHPWMTGEVIVGAAASAQTGMSGTTGDMSKVPEFGPVASLVLVIAIVSVVAVTAKTRGFLKL
ncbi:MAG: cupredoxin domain-containing protein [Nitrosopumilaceae archaeon]